MHNCDFFSFDFTTLCFSCQNNQIIEISIFIGHSRNWCRSYCKLKSVENKLIFIVVMFLKAYFSVDQSIEVFLSYEVINSPLTFLISKSKDETANVPQQ